MLREFSSAQAGRVNLCDVHALQSRVICDWRNREFPIRHRPGFFQVPSEIPPPCASKMEMNREESLLHIRFMSPTILEQSELFANRIE